MEAGGAEVCSSLADQFGGPLAIEDLVLVLRAVGVVAAGEAGVGVRGHDVLTATDVLRDRVAHGEFPRLVGFDLGDLVRIQVARAVCVVVFGVVPREPVAAVLRWQDGQALVGREALARMLGEAADLVESGACLGCGCSHGAGLPSSPEL